MWQEAPHLGQGQCCNAGEREDGADHVAVRLERGHAVTVVVKSADVKSTNPSDSGQTRRVHCVFALRAGLCGGSHSTAAIRPTTASPFQKTCHEESQPATCQFRIEP